MLFSALLGAGLALSAGCGDDDTKTQVPETAAETTAPDATVATETTAPDATVATETTAPDATVAAETEVQQEVNNECPPETAGKGKVGTPCTKNCECGDDNGELECYNGFYMEGFRFCTHQLDGRPSGTAEIGYISLLFPSDCYPDIPAANRPGLYAPYCDSVADCHDISTAYTHCGTSHLPYHSGGGGTQCPTKSSARDLNLQKSCIIDTLPPFDRSEVD